MSKLDDIVDKLVITSIDNSYVIGDVTDFGGTDIDPNDRKKIVDENSEQIKALMLELVKAATPIKQGGGDDYADGHDYAIEKYEEYLNGAIQAL